MRQQNAGQLSKPSPLKNLCTLGVRREVLVAQPEGFGFLFNRGMRLIPWEEALCARLKREHNVDPRQLAENDARSLATRETTATDFCLRGVRDLLEEVATV